MVNFLATNRPSYIELQKTIFFDSGRAEFYRLRRGISELSKWIQLKGHQKNINTIFSRQAFILERFRVDIQIDLHAVELEV
jgi:hypothetical protein